ncbi:hypothetical protein [Hyphomicrobium sp. MC8b]|uniref:hypothetical protein n=1 Tax=Hyphomicrobium sp. MC8b TaxID=300273 RepID=UPI00391C0A87
MSRSGTTMLHSLLMNSLPHFNFYEREISALQATEPADNLVTKRPLDCFSLDEIFAGSQEKNLKVIFCVRDPRAVVCSTHKMVPHDYFIGYRHQKRNLRTDQSGPWKDI